MNSSTSTLPAAPTPSRSSSAPSPIRTGRASSTITVKLAPGRLATKSPSQNDLAPDSELAQLRAQIAELETKLALYRRREALDKIYQRNAARDQCAAIIRAVAHDFQLSATLLIRPARSHAIAEARHVAMSLALELTDLTLTDIARGFHKKHHTTILYARKTVLAKCDTEPAFKSRVDRIRAALATPATNAK